MAAQIPIVEGGFAQVSDNVGAYFLQFKWHKCGFCAHIFRTVKEKKGYSIIYMAQEVMGARIPVGGACNPCPAVPDIQKKARKS